MSGSSCSSPVASVTPSDADSIYIQEGQMINFLRSDKGIEMFAKAHDMTKEDVINYIEAKKNGEDLYHNDHNTSPADHDDKHDEGESVHLSGLLPLLEPVLFESKHER